MPGLELFHRVSEPDSAEARRRVLALGLEGRVAFRNVEFPSHRDALAARGGGDTPALWDGARLHAGAAAVLAALAAAAAEERGAATRSAPLRPAPAALADAGGAPRLGAFSGSLGAMDLAPLAPPGLATLLRRKRWIYAVAASDEVLLAAAVVDAGVFGGAFAWAVDRRSGAKLFDRSRAGVPGLHLEVAGLPGPGARARCSAPGLRIAIARGPSAWTLSVAGWGGVRAEAALDAAAAPAPFALVAPVPGGIVRATQKAAPLRARGEVRVRARRLSLEGGHGGVDVTAGLLARETRWEWGFGAGLAGDVELAVNLCAGFGVAADDPGENVAWTAAGPYRLPPVAFVLEGASRWLVASAGREVELEFTPIGVHAERRRLGLVDVDFAQLAGTFAGRLPAPGGGSVAVAGLPGVVERHRARW